MSAYKQAIDRVRQHEGYLAKETFQSKCLDEADPETMVALIMRKGCLITQRHDLNMRYGGRDFLVNLMTEMAVLHISPQGHYSLHRWEKGVACSRTNQLPKEKEKYILTQLLEMESV